MASLALAGVCLSPTLAAAHVSVTSPAYANTTQKLTFGVGHGCEGADTYSIRVEIPAGVTSVRPVPSSFGKVTVEKDAAGIPVAVLWQRNSDADLAATDDNYYELTLRAKLPNTPFTTLFFKTRQTCKTPAGVVSTTDWFGTVQNEAEGTGAEPAPAVLVLPPRVPGWNKVTVPVAVPNVAQSKLFDDAQVVWKGTAAFSANPNTAAQIQGTAGVTALTSLAAGDEIWVKY